MECYSRANFKTGSEGRAPHSQLEDYAKRLEVYYKVLEGNDIDPTPPWTAKDGLAKEHLASVSPCLFDGLALVIELTKAAIVLEIPRT